MKLTALQFFKFDGKNIERGQDLETTSSYGRILVARKWAQVQREEKPKRAYGRRDMTVEQQIEMTTENKSEP